MAKKTKTKIRDLLEEFAELVGVWEGMEEDERQDTMDLTALEMRMEMLKAAGLVEGEGELDLELFGMLYGYAYGKGYRVSTLTAIIDVVE